MKVFVKANSDKNGVEEVMKMQKGFQLRLQ